MNSIRWLIVVGVCAFAAPRSHAQIDTSAAGERREKAEETLLDQNSALNESAILDMAPPLNSPGQSRTRFTFRSRFIQRLQPSVAYETGTYAGSRLQLYQRLTGNVGNFSGGMLYSKDAGERARDAFRSANLVYRSDAGWRAVLGDYRLECGQGISFWRGRDFSRGGDVLSGLLKTGRGIVATLSGDESSFLRGGAIEFPLGATRIIAFYSSRQIGATVTENGYATSLYASGYYRTEGEIARRSAVRETLYGARVVQEIANFGYAGVTAYQSGFSDPLYLDDGKKFSGLHSALLSADYSLRVAEVHTFGEVSLAGRTMSGIVSLALVPSDRFTAVVSVRAYPPSFFNFHAAGFGDNGETSNEYGVYAGIRFPLLTRCTFSGYFDRSIVPEDRSTHFNESGDEGFASLALSLPRGAEVSVQYAFSGKSLERLAEADPAENTEKFEVRRKERVRLQADAFVSTPVSMRLRAEKVFIHRASTGATEDGYLLLADLNVQAVSRVRSGLRLVIFRTDSYASGISEYESDMPGVASVPTLYGSGVRWYVFFRIKLTTKIAVSAKYSNLIRDDVRFIGTGSDQIRTDHDDRLGFQADIEL